MNMHIQKYIFFILFFTHIFFGAGCSGNPELVTGQFLLKTENEIPSSEPNRISVYNAVKKDLEDWPRELWTDSKATFTRPDNITALLLAGGASIYMHQQDDEKIADYFEEHNRFHGFSDESLYIIGKPTVHLAASSIWYLGTIINHDNMNQKRALTMNKAITINWLTFWGLKFARNNDTPNGKDWAWPSGHTSSSFTVASVLDEFYGHKVGIPAYALAGLIAYRMMDTGDHWGSDVVFGATLGWVVGHTVAGQDKDYKIAGFDIVPFIPDTEKPALGIGFMKRF